MPRIVLCAACVLFIGALVLDAPREAAQTPERVTITYWEKWTGFEGEAMRATIDRFNSKQIRNKKGQVIFCQYLSTNQIDRKALLAISGGQPPDMFGLWSFMLHTIADMNALRPLDDLMARDGFDTSAYVPVFLDMTRHRGTTWCLPSTPATTALHWNKQLFREAGLDPERPPRTLRELEEYADKITRISPTGAVERIGFLPPEPGWWHWSWGYFFGGKLNDGLEKLTIDDPRNIQSFEWIASFQKKIASGEKLLAFRQGFGTFDSPQNAFMSGRVGMVLQGVWMANFIRFNRPYLQYGCAPFPAAFETGENPVGIAETDVVAIPRGCRHVDEAWEVIKFINSREGMEFLCGDRANNGGQGKLTAFNENTPGWIEQHPHPYLPVFIAQAKSRNVFFAPKVPAWDEVRLQMNAAFDRVWLGNESPAQALQYVQRRMQAKLDRATAVRRRRDADTAGQPPAKPAP